MDTEQLNARANKLVADAAASTEQTNATAIRNVVQDAKGSTQHGPKRKAISKGLEEAKKKGSAYFTNE